MACYEPKIFDRSVQEVRGLLRCISVRCSVRAISADVIVIVVALGKRIHIGFRRDALMESRVENGALRGVRHKMMEHLDAFVSGWVMQRSQLFAHLELLEARFVYERGCAEVFASGDYPVSYRFDIVKGIYG